MLNHEDNYVSLKTFVHEWGHAIHAELSKTQNSFENYSPTTYIAELASTVNEIMLEDHLISNSQSEQEKLFYLLQALKNIHSKLFRQAMFTEFELFIYTKLKNNEFLTGKMMSAKFYELMKKYHGGSEQLVKIEEDYALTWAWNIQVFYKSLYVYKYATSINAAIHFAENINNGTPKSKENFISMLKKGGSDYSYKLLKESGLDMAKEQAYKSTYKRMNRLNKEAEKLLK